MSRSVTAFFESAWPIRMKPTFGHPTLVRCRSIGTLWQKRPPDKTPTEWARKPSERPLYPQRSWLASFPSPPSRSFTASPRPYLLSSPRSPHPFSLLQRRQLWGSRSSNMSPGVFSQLSHMEQMANNNPKSATAQNAFYSALLRANRPELVVERYESGKFASNPACEALYLRALERTSAAGQSTRSALSSNVGEEASNDDFHPSTHGMSATSKAALAATAKGGAGSKQVPLHVVVDQPLRGSLFQWVKFVLWYVFVIYCCYVVLGMYMEWTWSLRKLSQATKPEEARPEKQTTRFSDVQGCDEAIEELKEIVDFLKSPSKYSTLGGKLPKGVLLVGPPGTGKTLLARAVAGEAGVPFFYMSGSEFDEVFVGVGAKRIRDLFNSAKAKAPAIVFIDEIDAVGSKRNERDAVGSKQTLNQLLTELDGFNQQSGIIFIAATNFPKLLDKALLRPGRFDRQVVVDLPDVRGRISILNHYTKSLRLGLDVDTSLLARGTPGFSGADLQNLSNMAAVHASKRKAQRVEMSDFEWSKDKILMGAERRSAVIQHKDKVMTAYHEAGHALVALFTPHADPLYKATIMPRGMSLGLTFMLPEMDKVSQTKAEFRAKIDVSMGGKVAEELIYGDDAVTSGASSDIQNATLLAYNMVTRCGMSDALGNVDFHSGYQSLPAQTKELIWQEVRSIIEAGRSRAYTLLSTHRTELDRLANALVEYETLNRSDIEKAIKGEKIVDGVKGLPEAPLKIPIGLPPVPDLSGPGDGPEQPQPAPEPEGRPGAGPGGQGEVVESGPGARSEGRPSGRRVGRRGRDSEEDVAVGSRRA